MSERRRSGKRMQAFTATVLDWRWAVIIATLLSVAVTGYGLRFLDFDPDSRLFFGEDNPERLALDHIENTYSKANNIVIILAPRDGNIFTRRTLSAIADLTEEAWRTPYSSRVYSLTNYQHSRAEGDEIIVEDLVTDVAALSEEDIERVRAIALGSDMLVDRLVSAKGDVTAINILVTQPEKNLEEVPRIVRFARAMADRVRHEHPHIDVYLSGGVLADMTFAEAARQDLTSLVPLMIMLIVVALAIGLRSAYAMGATVLVILFSVVIALGLAGWTGTILNSGTSGAPIMIMALCIADCVHVIVTARQQRQAGLDRRNAIIESIRINAAPLCITSLTTAIGFIALNFSDSPPLRQLGNMVAVGELAGFVFSITFLPALMSVLPLPASRSVESSAVMWRFGEFVVRWRRPVLAGFAFLFVMLAAGNSRIVLDDDYIRYFDESFEFRAGTEFLQKRLTGLHVLQYSLPAGEEQGITEPEYLRKLDQFAEWFRSQDKVAHVSAFSDMMKRLNKNMHGDDPAFYRLPESRQLAAQYLLFYEMSLPFGHDLNNEIDIAKSATQVVVRLANVTSSDIRELGRRGEDWLRRNAPEMATPATGLSIVYAYISERNVRSMLIGTFLSLTLNSLVMLFVLRSPAIGMISLVPNLVPAVMAYGLWGHLFGQVNLAVSVVGAMTFGIIIDDTVHFLSKYVAARRELGLRPAEAICHSFATVGVPIALTTVVLVLGFAVLASSGFAVTSQMGMLSAIVIAIALGAELLFLPPLLLLYEKWTR